MSFLRPVSESVAKITKGTFARKFISLGRILSSWPEIVGEDLAGRAQPVKLHYRKPKSAADQPQATLDIAVTSADATLLHYQKDLILERINQLFGERWVTAIRFVHVAANEAEVAPAERRLSEDEKNAINQSLSHIEDEEIRKRLEKLGQGVLRKRGETA